MEQNHEHHDHHHGDLKGRKLAIAIVLNVAITAAQVVGGLISGSLALLSDALHNFSDVIALVISYLAEKLSSRDFTNEKTFGYKRAEILAAMINAVSLLLIGVALVQNWNMGGNSAGTPSAAQMAVVAGLFILLAVGMLNRRRGYGIAPEF